MNLSHRNGPHAFEQILYVPLLVSLNYIICIILHWCVLLFEAWGPSTLLIFYNIYLALHVFKVGILRLCPSRFLFIDVYLPLCLCLADMVCFRSSWCSWKRLKGALISSHAAIRPSEHTACRTTPSSLKSGLQLLRLCSSLETSVCISWYFLLPKGLQIKISSALKQSVDCVIRSVLLHRLKRSFFLCHWFPVSLSCCS